MHGCRVRLRWRRTDQEGVREGVRDLPLPPLPPHGIAMGCGRGPSRCFSAAFIWRISEHTQREACNATKGDSAISKPSPLSPSVLLPPPVAGARGALFAASLPRRFGGGDPQKEEEKQPQQQCQGWGLTVLCSAVPKPPLLLSHQPDSRYELRIEYVHAYPAPPPAVLRVSALLSFVGAPQ